MVLKVRLNGATPAAIAAATGATCAIPGRLPTLAELARDLSRLSPARSVLKAFATVRKYEWQYSRDCGQTWIDLPLADMPVLAELPVGTRITVRHRPARRNGIARWSKPESAVIGAVDV